MAPVDADGAMEGAAPPPATVKPVMPPPSVNTSAGNVGNAGSGSKGAFAVSPRSLAATSVASGSLSSSLGDAMNSPNSATGTLASTATAGSTGSSTGGATWSGLSQLLRRGSNAASSPRSASFDVDCLPTIMSPDHMHTPRRKTPQIDLGAAASSSSSSARILHVPCSFCGFLFVSAANPHGAPELDAKFCSTVCREMMVWRQPHMYQQQPPRQPAAVAPGPGAGPGAAQAFPPLPTAGGRA